MKYLELKIPPVITTIIFIGLMTLAAKLSPIVKFVFPQQELISMLISIAGIACIALAVIGFNKAKTTVNPTKPDDSSAIVSSGIYKFSRNPMYLGMLLILLGYAVNAAALSCYLLLVGFILFMNQYQIKPEERLLSAKFGNEYTNYLTQVRRWI